MQQIKLLPNKEVFLQRRHPWIFSGALQKTTIIEDGTLVEVLDSKGRFQAIGHFFNGSIAVKILSFEQVEIDLDFWKKKLDEAAQIRFQMFDTNQTNIFRLIHGEGDGFPGLIIDYFAGVAVFQAHSVGMWKNKEVIVEALKAILGENLLAIYDKSKETLPEAFASKIQNEFLFGNVDVPHLAIENGCKFNIDWITGQKTGFFIDQRENRKLLQNYVNGKSVLNTFCYSGGFSVFALEAKAEKVVSVDVSKKAIDLVNNNIALNFGQEPKHESVASDVMSYLKENSGQFDVIILDPPAYAKNVANRHKAVQGYKRLNIEGIKHLAPNGILFTFSCSQVVDNQLFYDTLVAAAIEAKREIRVLHQLSQGPDHPVNIFHKEGSYLKGLVLQVK